MKRAFYGKPLSFEMKQSRLLLLNPWIHDFAAYDFWLRPTGLLYLASRLRRWGFEVHYIDCLDRYNPRLLERQKRSSPRGKPDGRGKFHREEIPKPPILREIPRRYGRYGVPPDIILEELASVPKPSAVLVTSSMTYWYPGVQETIAMARKVFPGVTIILGGTYATLTPDHARVHSGADYVVEGRDVDHLKRILEGITGEAIRATSDAEFPSEDDLPAYDLLRDTSSMVLYSSWGCPFRCTYCASWKISGKFRQRDSVRVVDEIDLLSQKYRTKHFVFFDDALLFAKESRFLPILREIIRRRIHGAFHTPNAIHPRYLDRETAAAMKEANFQTICLGLETSSSSMQLSTGAKVNNSEFVEAVALLEEAGFDRRPLEVYAMMGLPGQGTEEIRETLRFVNGQGCTIRLTTYSPIPGTEEWKRAIAASDLPLASDPLLHNGSIYPVRNRAMTWSVFEELRAFARDLNEKLSGTPSTT